MGGAIAVGVHVALGKGAGSQILLGRSAARVRGGVWGKHPRKIGKTQSL